MLGNIELLSLFWETILAITPIVAIIFILILFGWWAGKTLIKAAQRQLLSSVVVGCVIPFWLFLNALTADLYHLLPTTYNLVYFLCALLLSAIILVFIQRQIAATILASIYSNTLYFSLPIIALMLGHNAMSYALPIIMLNTFFVLSCYELIKQVDERQSLRFKVINKIFINSLGNPIVMSILLGIVGNWIFSVNDALLSLKESAAIPVLSIALFSLGVSLQSIHNETRSYPWFAVINKLLVFPCLVFCGAYYWLGLTGDLIYVLVILAASPVAINSYFFVAGDKGAELLMGRCILLTSLLCVLSMPLWILFLTIILPVPTTN